MALVNQEEVICAICHEALGPQGNYSLRTFRCQHSQGQNRRFHMRCACIWSGVCPLCREPRLHFMSFLPRSRTKRRRLLYNPMSGVCHIIDLRKPVNQSLMFMHVTEVRQPMPNNEVFFMAFPGGFHVDIDDFLRDNLPLFTVTDIYIDEIDRPNNRRYITVTLTQTQPNGRMRSNAFQMYIYGCNNFGHDLLDCVRPYRDRRQLQPAP
jgi:hypothetical protein